MARLVLPARLELNRPAGSSSEAPLAKVIFTTLLYVSPVQMIPACDQTGTPAMEFDGFRHLTSSITSGSACLMRARSRASVSPRQSSSSTILASMSWEGESPAFPSVETLLVFFMVVVDCGYGRCRRRLLAYRSSLFGAIAFRLMREFEVEPAYQVGSHLDIGQNGLERVRRVAWQQGLDARMALLECNTANSSTTFASGGSRECEGVCSGGRHR